MAEYIDRDAALSEIERREALMVGDKRVSVDAMKSFIKNRPAADVAPVRHGRWILEAHDERANGRWIVKGYACGETEYQCSECKETEWRTSASRLKYCPFCGAKMDGGAENG